MKTIKFSAFLLLSGLFIASCGNDAQSEGNSASDSTMVGEDMAQTVPNIENGDTTVNINSSTTTNQGDDQDGTQPAYNEDLPKNSTDESTVGKPTKNPAKSPSTGHPGALPDNPSSSSPSQ